MPSRTWKRRKFETSLLKYFRKYESYSWLLLVARWCMVGRNSHTMWRSRNPDRPLSHLIDRTVVYPLSVSADASTYSVPFRYIQFTPSTGFFASGLIRPAINGEFMSYQSKTLIRSPSSPKPIRVSTIKASPGDYITLALNYATVLQHTPMKVLSVALGIFFTTGFIQTTMGLTCGTDCAACWLDNNSNGVDIKMICDGECPKCPSGYSRQHCAEERRCR